VILFRYRWRKNIEGNQLTHVHLENGRENGAGGGGTGSGELA